MPQARTGGVGPAAVLMALLAIAHVATGAPDATEAYGFDDADTLIVDFSAQFHDAEAGQIRHLADADRDGTVTSPEATAQVHVFQERGIEALRARVLLNGKPPLDVTPLMVDVEGLAGPVDAPDPVQFRAAAEVSFEVLGSAGAHVFLIQGPNGSNPAPTQVVFHAPEGATITSHSGLADPELGEDLDQLHGTLGPGDAIIVYEIPYVGAANGGPHEAAAPAAAATILAAVVLGAVLRRRP